MGVADGVRVGGRGVGVSVPFPTRGEARKNILAQPWPPARGIRLTRVSYMVRLRMCPRNYHGGGWDGRVRGWERGAGGGAAVWVGHGWAGDSHSTLVVNSLPRRDPTDKASAAKIAVSTTVILQVGSGWTRGRKSTVTAGSKGGGTGQYMNDPAQTGAQGGVGLPPWHHRGWEIGVNSSGLAGAGQVSASSSFAWTLALVLEGTIFNVRLAKDGVR